MTKRALYPGTFDPIHLGHLDLVHRAAALFDELVIAVSDHGQALKSALFSVDERIALIHDALNGMPNVQILPFSGLVVDFAREVHAPFIVRGLRVFSDFEFEFRFSLANKRLAPEIEVVNFITREEHTFLSGTTVREIASLKGNVSSMVPPNVDKALRKRFEESDDSFNHAVSLRD